MRKCPFCSEEIQIDTIKCSHCDSDLSAVNNKQASQQIKASDHTSYWTFTILGLLLPIVGIIVGIVYLTKDNELDRKLGEHVIAMSILLTSRAILLHGILNTFHLKV